MDEFNISDFSSECTPKKFAGSKASSKTLSTEWTEPEFGGGFSSILPRLEGDNSLNSSKNIASIKPLMKKQDMKVVFKEKRANSNHTNNCKLNWKGE